VVKFESWTPGGMERSHVQYKRSSTNSEGGKDGEDARERYRTYREMQETHGDAKATQSDTNQRNSISQFKFFFKTRVEFMQAHFFLWKQH
jgi:hypothetical protein